MSFCYTLPTDACNKEFTTICGIMQRRYFVYVGTIARQSAIHRIVTSLSDAGLPANFVTLSRILAFYRLTSTRGAVKEEGGGLNDGCEYVSLFHRCNIKPRFQSLNLVNAYSPKMKFWLRPRRLLSRFIDTLLDSFFS